MSPRSGLPGAKMDWLALGWLRPVLARNGDSRQRLQPSRPTARILEPGQRLVVDVPLRVELIRG